MGVPDQADGAERQRRRADAGVQEAQGPTRPRRPQVRRPGDDADRSCTHSRDPARLTREAGVEDIEREGRDVGGDADTGRDFVSLAGGIYSAGHGALAGRPTTAVGGLDPRRLRQRDAVLREPAAYIRVVLELGDARVVAGRRDPEHHVFVTRLLDQVREAAADPPPVDEDRYVAIREVGVPWKHPAGLVVVKHIQDAGARRALGGRQARYIPRPQLTLDAAELGSEAGPSRDGACGADGRA